MSTCACPPSTSPPIPSSGPTTRGPSPGELLWPEHVDEPALGRIKAALGSYGSAGPLQQRPAPDEGGILKRSWWRRWDGKHETAPHFDTIVQSWDMAFTDTDGSDYVVGQVWGRFGADKYLLRQVRARLEFTETVQAVIDLTEWVEENYPARRTHAKLVEDKANGPAVISQLRRRVPGLIAVKPQGDKVARARAVAPDVEAGNVHLPGAANAAETDYDPTLTPDWVKGLVDECAALPNAAHDDQVDALSQSLMRLAGQSGSYRQKGGMKTRMGGMRTREL